jgi:hypothetical protein
MDSGGSSQISSSAQDDWAMLSGLPADMRAVRAACEVIVPIIETAFRISGLDRVFVGDIGYGLWADRLISFGRHRGHRLKFGDSSSASFDVRLAQFARDLP